MTSATFLVPENEKVNIPPTWFDGGYRNFTMAGVVSDGNAYSLGGISGHAGIFYKKKRKKKGKQSYFLNK